jgi:hypothetical protein
MNNSNPVHPILTLPRRETVSESAARPLAVLHAWRSGARTINGLVTQSPKGDGIIYFVCMNPISGVLPDDAFPEKTFCPCLFK